MFLYIVLAHIFFSFFVFLCMFACACVCGELLNFDTIGNFQKKNVYFFGYEDICGCFFFGYLCGVH